MAVCYSADRDRRYQRSGYPKPFIKAYKNYTIMKQRIWDLSQVFVAILFITGLFVQSCSKKVNGDGQSGIDQGPVETDTWKLVPDSMFRVYLKANVCPNSFDKTGKMIDITNNEVKSFTGAMTIDTI